MNSCCSYLLEYSKTVYSIHNLHEEDIVGLPKNCFAYKEFVYDAYGDFDLGGYEMIICPFCRKKAYLMQQE